MQVLLLRDIKKVGKKGTVVQVKEGYGRNFLIAQGFAKEATSSNLKSEAENKHTQQIKSEKRKSALNTFFENNFSFEIEKPANEEGKLFGSFFKKDFLDVVHKVDPKIDLKETEIAMDHIKHTSSTNIKILPINKDVTLIIKRSK